MVKGTTDPRTKFGTVEVEVARKLVPNCSALLMTKAITAQEAREMMVEDQKQWANSRDSLINNISKSYSVEK